MCLPVPLTAVFRLTGPKLAHRSIAFDERRSNKAGRPTTLYTIQHIHCSLGAHHTAQPAFPRLRRARRCPTARPRPFSTQLACLDCLACSVWDQHNQLTPPYSSSQPTMLPAQRSVGHIVGSLARYGCRSGADEGGRPHRHCCLPACPARNKVDISKLTPAEQQAFRMYGKLPSRSVNKVQVGPESRIHGPWPGQRD